MTSTSCYSPPRSRLECSICYEIFTRPKILPCFHTFCQPCLETLVAQTSARRLPHTFKCPTCRSEIYLPANGVAGFQANFYIHDEVLARKAKNFEACVLHREQRVTQICTNCDVMICEQCKTTNHTQHPAVLLGDEIASAKEELKTLQAELESRSLVVENALSRLPDQQKEIDKKMHEIKKHIRQKTKMWVSQLKRARDESFAKVDALASYRKMRLNKTVLLTQKDQQKTRALLAQTESALTDGRGVAVLAARDRLRPEALEQEKLSKIVMTLESSSEMPPLDMRTTRLANMDDLVNELSVAGFFCDGGRTPLSNDVPSSNALASDIESDDGNDQVIPVDAYSPDAASDNDDCHYD